MENDILMCDCVLRECHAIVIEFVSLLWSYIGIKLLLCYLKIIVQTDKMEKKKIIYPTIIVAMATKQPHFASSNKRQKYGFS